MRAAAGRAFGHHGRHIVLKLLALTALLMLLNPVALAKSPPKALLDRVGFQSLEELGDELGLSGAGELAGKLLEGKFMPGSKELRQAASRLARALAEPFLEALSILAGPVLATLCIRALLGRCDGALALLCRLACAVGLAGSCASGMALARSIMVLSARVANAAAPVLAATLSLTGAGMSSAVISPASALCVGIIEDMLIGPGLTLCAFSAVIAAGCGLSERLRLDRLFQLVCKSAVWGLRLLAGLFMALLAVEGRLAALQDTAASRALRQALRGLVPFIGASVSDTSGALVETAAALRGTVGVTGMALAICACVHPMAKLIARALSMKLASALMEPLADPGISRMTAGLAEVSGLLVALCAVSVLMVLLLCGSCLWAAGPG